MNKLIALMAVFFVLSMVAVSAAPATMVYGKITLDDNVTPVVGADVTVDCNGNILATTSGADGMYYVFYPNTDCTAGDMVTVSVDYGDGEATGSGEGEVSFSEVCKINTSLVNVSIPEFGVIAAGVALIGAVAIFAVKRKN